MDRGRKPTVTKHDGTLKTKHTATKHDGTPKTPKSSRCKSKSEASCHTLARWVVETRGIQDFSCPQCQSKLKAMLRKHVAVHGNQWDKFPHGKSHHSFSLRLTVVHPPKQPISPPLPPLRSLLQITVRS